MEAVATGRAGTVGLRQIAPEPTPKRCHLGRAGRQHGECHADCSEGRPDVAHSKSAGSYRIFEAPVWALESRPNRCLQPTKPDNRHFRDYPLTRHAADMPKSTLMTQSAADQRVTGTPGA